MLNKILILILIFNTKSSFCQLKFKILDSLIFYNNKKILSYQNFAGEINEIIVDLNSKKIEFQLLDKSLYCLVKNDIVFDSLTFFKLKSKYINVKNDTLDFSESKISSLIKGENILIILNPIFDGWLPVEKLNRINEIEKFGIKMNKTNPIKIYIPYYLLNYNGEVFRGVFIYDL